MKKRPTGDIRDRLAELFAERADLDNEINALLGTPKRPVDQGIRRVGAPARGPISQADAILEALEFGPQPKAVIRHHVFVIRECPTTSKDLDGVLGSRLRAMIKAGRIHMEVASPNKPLLADGAVAEA